MLTQVAGLSYAEAAMVCEVPIGTIRSRVARARADLLDGLIDERESGLRLVGASSSGVVDVAVAADAAAALDPLAAGQVGEPAPASARITGIGPTS